MAGAVDPIELLRSSRSVLLIDWPSRDVPDSLARAGLDVSSADGPDAYNAYEAAGGKVRVRRLEGPPEHSDIVYAYRPIDELPDIINQALTIGARAIWLEHASLADAPRGRDLVESAGLTYIDQPSIVQAARSRNSG
ncbi:MAG TPA: CoA-binding protein [Candidatus Limnocylindrales bacterium]